MLDKRNKSVTLLGFIIIVTYFWCMECLNCKNDVPQTKGKRAKLYCSQKCRVEYFRAKEAAITPKRGPGRPPKNLAAQAQQETEQRQNPLINAARGRDASGVNEDELVLAQKEAIREEIAEIRAEKIPAHRNTSIWGQKSWKLEQQKRIQELENKIK